MSETHTPTNSGIFLGILTKNLLYVVVFTLCCVAFASGLPSALAVILTLGLCVLTASMSTPGIGEQRAIFVAFFTAIVTLYAGFPLAEKARLENGRVLLDTTFDAVAHRDASDDLAGVTLTEAHIAPDYQTALTVRRAKSTLGGDGQTTSWTVPVVPPTWTPQEPVVIWAYCPDPACVDTW